MFNPDLLIVARTTRGLSQVTLAERAGITQGHLSKLENGLSVPSSDVLARAASALDYPVSFFGQSDRVIGLPLSVQPAYRRKASVGQRDLEKVRAYLNIRLMHLRRLLQATEYTAETILPAYDADEYDGDVERIAQLVRRTWLLPPGPIKNLTDIVERAGVVVVLCDFPNATIDGLSIVLPDLPPCIFLNRVQQADRLRFSLAHELGHLVMHSQANPDMERQAHSFASALLMPAEDIRSYFASGVTLKRLATMKPLWRVSIQALAMRAKSVGSISENQHKYLWMQLSKAGLRRREPPELDFPAEEPKILSALIRMHTERLGYTMVELAAALHTYESELRHLYSLTGARLRVVGDS